MLRAVLPSWRPCSSLHGKRRVLFLAHKWDSQTWPFINLKHVIHTHGIGGAGALGGGRGSKSDYEIAQRCLKARSETESFQH